MTFATYTARRTIVRAAALAALIAAPTLAFAESNQPVTRAEVRAQIVELEQAGYNPFGYEGRLHRNMEAAERVIAQRRASALQYQQLETSAQPDVIIQASK